MPKGNVILSEAKDPYLVSDNSVTDCGVPVSRIPVGAPGFSRVNSKKRDWALALPSLRRDIPPFIHRPSYI
jgi:hypothetical protein